MTPEPVAGDALRGRVALVTGASSGLGRAIAIALGAAGATPIVVGRDEARLRETADAAGPTAEVVRCDLSVPSELEALVHRIALEVGRLDVLVHAAGDIAFGPVASAPVDDLDRLIDVNLRAPYVLTQRLLPLLEQGRGHVVFLNSSAGIRSSAGVAAYGATKHALRGLADALRDEVNPHGVRVTSVYPGRTRTPMQASVHRWEGRDEMGDLLEPQDVATMVVALLALPPRAEVTDLHVRPAYPPLGDAR